MPAELRAAHELVQVVPLIGGVVRVRRDWTDAAARCATSRPSCGRRRRSPATASSSTAARSSRQRKLGSSWKPTHIRSAAKAESGATSDEQQADEDETGQAHGRQLLRGVGRVTESSRWSLPDWPRERPICPASRNFAHLHETFTTRRRAGVAAASARDWRRFASRRCSTARLLGRVGRRVRFDRQRGAERVARAARRRARGSATGFARPGPPRGAPGPPLRSPATSGAR